MYLRAARVRPAAAAAAAAPVCAFSTTPRVLRLQSNGSASQGKYAKRVSRIARDSLGVLDSLNSVLGEGGPAHDSGLRFRGVGVDEPLRSSYRAPSETPEPPDTASKASKASKISNTQKYGPPPPPQAKYARFGALLDTRFSDMMTGLGAWHPGHQEYASFGLTSQAEVDTQVRLFRRALAACIRTARVDGHVGRGDNPLFWSLRNAFVRGDMRGLARELKYAFQSHVLRAVTPQTPTALQARIADFRFPAEWYPATRSMQRTVHVHVGPTNSGKTYRALLALEGAQTGIYAGPLRLLAHEIYTRFTAKGKPCALITGEEQRFPMADGSVTDPTDPASMSVVAGMGGVAETYFESCTVEMTPLNKRVDVAVIDEIQMIADPERGWAWTQALLGVQAREVHVCGEERAVELVEALCRQVGDTCHVHRYTRLSGLETARTSLGGFRNLRKGDAVVAFSRMGLHSLKEAIEKETGRRCAIVYGSLPPETRAAQAALFNDPDNEYDFLVASDAIGMGLNLEIKRVIFEAAFKHDGTGFRHLHVPEIKQIGGRAGRFKSAAAAVRSGSNDTNEPEKTEKTSVGVVTTLEDEDLGMVQDAFREEAEPLQRAGIQPPTFAIEQFSRYFPPETAFSFILTRLRELAQVSPRFQLCKMKEQIEVADIIQTYPMSVYDRCVFIAAPTMLRDPQQVGVLRALARCVSANRGGSLVDIAEIDLEALDGPAAAQNSGKYLQRLESLHKSITLYLWLSYRFAGVFTTQRAAFEAKVRVEERITEALTRMSFVDEKRRKRVQKVRKEALRQQRLEDELRRSEAQNAATVDPAIALSM